MHLNCIVATMQSVAILYGQRVTITITKRA